MSQNPRSILEHALERVSDSADAQTSTLEQCLDVIDGNLAPRAPGWVPDTEEGWWWIHRRLETLQQLDRVATALKLCQGVFNKDVYVAIRNGNLVDIAHSAASTGNLTTVSILLTTHPYSLVPHILDILSSIPETMPPKVVEPVLRQIASLRAPPALPRPADWTENDAVYAALLRRRREDARFLDATENLIKYSSSNSNSNNDENRNTAWLPPNAAQLTFWARRRAVAIDRLTGQLAAAMEMLEVTRAVLHFSAESQPLSEMHRSGQQLLLVIKLAASRGEDAAWRIDLGTFASMDDVGKLQTLLQLTDSDALAEEIPRVILPFLNQLGDENGGSGQGRTVRRALEREAASRLSWVVRFLQAESQRHVVLENTAEIVGAACAAAYACPSAEAWSLQEALLYAATDAIDDGDTTKTLPPQEHLQQKQALQKSIAVVQGHLTAARTLTKYGLSTSLAAVRDASRDEVSTVVKTLLARVARTNPGESRWSDLWADLKIAQEAGLQALPLEGLRAEMCRALLGCAQLRLVQKHLTTLPAELQEVLVLDAARDAFYSVDTPDDAAVRRAQDILKVLPESKAAVEEASFIRAAARLRALGVDMPPLQLRQSPDKGNVLRQAVAVAPAAALKDVDGFVELSKALKTGIRRTQVLTLVAEAALAAGQSRLAENVAVQLASERSSDGWQVAARVALEEPCSSEGIRRRLLAYAMHFAPSDELDGQLHCWQASDAGAAGDAQVWSVPEGDPSVFGLDYLKVLQSTLEFSLFKGNGSAEDSLLSVCCLLSLEIDGQLKWAQRVQQQQGSMSSLALRQAHVVSIVAAAVTALAASNQTLMLENDAVASSTTTTTESTTKSSPRTTLLSLPPKELLIAALQPHKHATAAPITTTTESTLSSFSSSTSTAVAAAAAAAAAVGDTVAVNSLLLDLSKHLVASADAQRVARMLPGHLAAENWSQGGAAAQRSVVLQLAAAAAAASGGGENIEGIIDDNTDEVNFSSAGIDKKSGVLSSLPSSPPPPAARPAAAHQLQPSPSRKKSESLSLHSSSDSSAVFVDSLDGIGIDSSVASLEHALTLAQRCNVAPWEVHLAYAAAVMTRGGDTLVAADRDLNKVWAALLESRPNETAAMMLNEVYPLLNTGTTRQLERVVWVLKRCAECFNRGGAAAMGASQRIQEEKEVENNNVVCSTVLIDLADAALALHTACSDIDVKVFLHPPLQLICTAWLKEFCSSSTSSSLDTASASAAVTEQLLEYCDAGNASDVAHAVNAISALHSTLVDSITSSQPETEISTPSFSSFPAASSTVYVATLCKELSAMAVSEGADSAQILRLETLFAGTTPSDGFSTAAFACLGAAPPLIFPGDPPMVLLSPEQALVVLNAVFNAVTPPQLDGAPAAPAAALAARLQSERIRLSVLLQIEEECGNELTGEQIQRVQAFVPQLQRLTALHTDETEIITASSSSSPENEAQTLLIDSLAVFLAEGCPFRAVCTIAGACTSIGSWAAADDVVFPAAEAAVRAALSALRGTSITSSSGGDSALEVEYNENVLSIGDAVQNLYGVLRSLDDDDDDAVVVDGESSAQLKLKAQSGVWRQLQQHAATDQSSSVSSSSDTAAASVEAHLQVLQMLDSLGSSMWKGWKAPYTMETTALDSIATTTAATTTVAATGGGGGVPFNHKEALLHSRVAASLAQTWPSAVREAKVVPADFSCLENVEAAMMRMVDRAESVQQYSAVVTGLSDVLSGVSFLSSPGSGGGGGDDDEDAGTTDSIRTPSLVDPLHRVWSACLTALVSLGALSPVISALDSRITESQKRLLTEAEADLLVAAAETALGTLASTAVALYLPYMRIQEREWSKIVSLQACEDVRGLSGVPPLFIAALCKQNLLPDLSRRNPAVFKQLTHSILQQNEAALWNVAVLGSGKVVSLRTAVAVVAAGQLVESGQQSAAAWVAMQHAGTHSFLRILDSGRVVLMSLLRAGAAAKGNGGGGSGGGAMSIELEPAAVEAVLGASTCARAVMESVPEVAASALAHLVDT